SQGLPLTLPPAIRLVGERRDGYQFYGGNPIKLGSYMPIGRRSLMLSQQGRNEASQAGVHAVQLVQEDAAAKIAQAGVPGEPVLGTRTIPTGRPIELHAARRRHAFTTSQRFRAVHGRPEAFAD